MEYDDKHVHVCVLKKGGKAELLKKQIIIFVLLCFALRSHSENTFIYILIIRYLKE